MRVSCNAAHATGTRIRATKTVHIGGGPGDDHMRFEQDFCSCGAVEAFFDDH
mgnify:CR=1 FL=1